MANRKTKKKKGAKAQARNRAHRRNAVVHPTPSDTCNRAFHVAADMRRDASLTLAQAARNREIDPRTVRRQIPSAFLKDSSGRIRARTSDRFRQTLYIPTTTPGVRTPILTKNSHERQQIGSWMAALNAAGRGDFSDMNEFPRQQFVGGVHLPTNAEVVQRILNALAEEEAPFEGLYRTIARPS